MAALMSIIRSHISRYGRLYLPCHTEIVKSQWIKVDHRLSHFEVIKRWFVFPLKSRQAFAHSRLREFRKEQDL